MVTRCLGFMIDLLVNYLCRVDGVVLLLTLVSAGVTGFSAAGFGF